MAKLDFETETTVLKEHLLALRCDEQHPSDLPKVADGRRDAVEKERARFAESAIKLERLKQELAGAERHRSSAQTDPEIELLEMEIEADRAMLRKMMAVLRETELQKIQGFGTGPVIGGKNREEQEAAVAKYAERYDRLRREFSNRCKELSKLRRRASESER